MKRSLFSLSHDVYQTMNMGMLNPIGCVDVLPGDTVQHATQSLIRMAPLNSPVMHPTHAKIMHFFVPYRLIFDEFEDFITRGPDGDSVPVWPTIAFDKVDASTLANYLGYPIFDTGAQPSIELDATPFRAYNLIFNEYFRDQDLKNERVIDYSGGLDTTTDVSLAVAAWEKDYFTSARPWTQKGPEVTIPIAGMAPVEMGSANAGQIVRNADGTLRATTNYLQSNAVNSLLYDVGGGPLKIDPNGTLFANLSDVPGVDINDLRLALALQRFEEARARWGSRYTEYLRYLGVKSSDARLQRPEYLGGGRQTIQFSEVLQTAPDDAGEGVGDLFGHGIAAMSSNRYRRFFEEHGLVMSFMVVRPKAIYADGIPRRFLRRTFVDFWQQELQHIGQQEVQNQEVYALSAQPTGTFGFQDRYDEYRRTESRVAGEFATTLNYWTMARIFDSEPSLNADFVDCIPDPRIFQSTATDQMYVMTRHSMQARRLVAQTGNSFIF